MRLWLRRGRRGRAEGRSVPDPSTGDAATEPEPTQAPDENPVVEPEPELEPAPASTSQDARAADSQPREVPVKARGEDKSAARSKHSKKHARAAAAQPEDPFDRALDRLRSEIPATDEDGFR